MRRLLLVLLCAGILCGKISGQNPQSYQSPTLDSIMALRQTQVLAGLPRTIYSPGYQQKAEEYQALFSGAMKFYARQYHQPLELKMAVLDSAQWVRERVPYGFLSYDSGWVMLAANTSYETFLRLYDIGQKASALEKFLKAHQLTPVQLLSSIYRVYSVHEFGHYFIIDAMRRQESDLWAGELIATYISYAYFKSIGGKDLENLELFSGWLIKNYQPKFRRIEDMDSLYANMDVPNFKWLHCNIVLLCRDLYRKAGMGFIDYYCETFAPGTDKKYSTRQVLNLLSKYYPPLLDRWKAYTGGD